MRGSAFGRAGSGLPTQAHLAFQWDYAHARDAVHLPLDAAAVAAELKARGWDTMRLHRAGPDRLNYLQRPDLGRRLDETSLRTLEPWAGLMDRLDVVFVIADGLSARAIHEHAIPVLDRILPALSSAGWHVGPIPIVEQGRVAIGDEIGERLNAEVLVMPIGERSG